MTTPMLAQPMRRSHYTPKKLLASDDWVCEPKIDGRRLLVERSGNKVSGWGRDGQLAKVPKGIVADLSEVSADIAIDGELIDNQLIAFDLIHAGESLAGAPLTTRRQWLSDLISAWEPANVRLMPQATTSKEKRAMRNRVKRNRGEGVVWKRANSPYLSGRSRNWTKDKFVKDLDVVILGRGVEKENFSIGLFGEEGDIVPVGEVASFTGDGPKLTVGDVATVTVLYVSEGKRLVQPVKPRKRTDKKPKECTIDQLRDLVPSKKYILRWA